MANKEDFSFPLTCVYSSVSEISSKCYFQSLSFGKIQISNTAVAMLSGDPKHQIMYPGSLIAQGSLLLAVKQGTK